MSEVPPKGPSRPGDAKSNKDLDPKNQARIILGHFERILRDQPRDSFQDTAIREDFIEPFQISLWDDPIKMPSDDDIEVLVKANLHFRGDDGFKYQYYLRAEEDKEQPDGWAYSLASRHIMTGEDPFSPENLTRFEKGWMEGARVEFEDEEPIPNQDEQIAHAEEIKLGLTDATPGETAGLIKLLEAIE